MANISSSEQAPSVQSLEGAKESSSYKAVYAPLLVHSMSRGYSLESFAALVTNRRQVLEEDPCATWLDSTGDFCKERVDLSTVDRWRREHRDFASAYEEGWPAALLFYERRLLSVVTGEEKISPEDLDSLLVVLQTRFGEVYGQEQVRGAGLIPQLRGADII